MSPFRRLAVCALATLLGGAVPAAAVAAEDFAFFHENVLGTSCELRVRADSEEAARCAEERVLSEVDRLAAIFSGYDPTSEFSRWQATADRPTRLSDGAVRSPPGERRLADPIGRRVRSTGGGAQSALVEDLPAGSTADTHGDGRGAVAHGSAGVAPRSRVPHRRSHVGLSTQPERDRQGLHRRARLRSGTGAAPGRSWSAPEHRRRSPGLRRAGADDRDRKPAGRLGDDRTARGDRGPEPIGRHQRQLSARI